MSTIFKRGAGRLLTICALHCFMIFHGVTYASSEAILPAQEMKKRITGYVYDIQRTPLPGTTVMIDGSTKGVITDNEGFFVMEDVSSSDKLVISFIGMNTEVIEVGEKKMFEIILHEKSEELEEVQVVAFGKQKKESVISSISTIKPSELKLPSSNLTASFAGRLAGLISYQQSGEPGKDNANFFVRGIGTFGANAKADPLILIDGMELSSQDLTRLNPDDIASFSIMKDALATSLYGARGANGVILVTTREGREGKAKVTLNFENSISMPTRDIAFADPITYMKLHNEAVETRDPLALRPYGQEKITMTERGLYPDYYPTTDWSNLLFKEQTMNQRLYFNINGGGKVARYSISANATLDNGMLKSDSRNNFDPNVSVKKYQLNSNININISNTSEVTVRLRANMDDYHGPMYGASTLYSRVMSANPALFKPYYAPDSVNTETSHILFGNIGTSNYVNPYADMLSGYQDRTQSLMLAQFELKQKLDFITKGLNGRFMLNTSRYSDFYVNRGYKPFYYHIQSFSDPSTPYRLEALNPREGTEYIDYDEGPKSINSIIYFESALDYLKERGSHTFTGLMVYTMRQYLASNSGTLQSSLPQRNMGLAGRFTYDFDKRYFAEFGFGYNGSERFSTDKRFGFFPSFGVAWYLSNEQFFEPLNKFFTQFKLKATYGLGGNDAIGDLNDRFFYLSSIEMNNEERRVTFGEHLDNTINGVRVMRYANPQIGWETSYKTDLGLEMTIRENWSSIISIYKERRKNILVNRVVPATMGLGVTTQANLGIASGKGIDIETNYQKFFGNGLWINARGTFTYATSKVEKWEEPDYSATPWISKVNRPIMQQWGYIAERLFIDEEDIKNSPTQIGEYLPGDIKYRDINDDGRISSFDQVPIGHPTVPEIIYGFGPSIGFKNVDFSFFFQGSARQSFWIDNLRTAPFIDWDDPDFPSSIENNALLKAYADSHWSASIPNQYALWPRLSNHLIENNHQLSTWFMQDASFIRLKSLEIGYTLSGKKTNNLGVESIRLYMNGINLITWSPFKLWDPEMAGNGLGYPVQKVYNLGLKINF